MDYEKWYASVKTNSAGYEAKTYVCSVVGYMSGNQTTLTARISAASITEAKRWFDAMIEEAHMVNWSGYHVQQVR